MFDEAPSTNNPRAIAMEYLEKHKLKEIFEVLDSFYSIRDKLGDYIC